MSTVLNVIGYGILGLGLFSFLSVPNPNFADPARNFLPGYIEVSIYDEATGETHNAWLNATQSLYFEDASADGFEDMTWVEYHTTLFLLEDSIEDVEKQLAKAMQR